MSEPRFCQNCGAAMQPGQEFCKECGEKAEDTSTQQDLTSQQYTSQPQVPPQPQYTVQTQYTQQPQYTPQPQYPGNEPQSSGNVLSIISILMIVLAAGIVAVLLLFGPVNAKAKDLGGQWASTIKVEKILKDNSPYISKDELGKVKDVTMSLVLKEDGTGSMIMNDAQFNVAYKDGRLLAEASEGNVKLHFEGQLKKESNRYVIEGSWKYLITSGSDAGDLAAGSWKATFENSSVSQPTIVPAAVSSPKPALTSSPATPAVSGKEFDGSWIGTMTLVEIPNLDSNTSIPDDEKKTMKESIGQPIDTGFVFKNGKFWVGDSADAEDIQDSDMGAVTFQGSSFTSDVETSMGKAHVTGEMIDESGTKKIKGKIEFGAVPYSGNITVPVIASFEAVKQ